MKDKEPINYITPEILSKRIGYNEEMKALLLAERQQHEQAIWRIDGQIRGIDANTVQVQGEIDAMARPKVVPFRTKRTIRVKL